MPRRRPLRRGSVLALLGLAGAAAVAARELGACRSRVAEPPEAGPPASTAPPPVSSVDAASPDAIAEDGTVYPVRAYTFDLAHHALRLVDVHMSRSLRRAFSSEDDVLAVNAAFFDEEDRPVGLARSEGQELSPLRPALSGGVLTFMGHHAAIYEAETFDPHDPSPFAVQCRPRLVVSGVPNVQRDDGKRAERTALCLRDGGATLEVVIVRGDEGARRQGPSLFALGHALAARGCHDALNLDGGPSTGLVVRERGRLEDLPPRRPVRHALVVRRTPG